MSFIASFVFSLTIQDKLTKFHTYSKFNLYLYSLVFFTIGGVPLYYISGNDGVLDSIATEVLLYGALLFQGAGLANMMNTSTSLVSEMIGQDDEASAKVFACFNILESFSVGGVGYIIMACGLTDSGSSLKFTLAIIPALCALACYVESWIRFHNAADQYYGNTDQADLANKFKSMTTLTKNKDTKKIKSWS